VDLSEDMLALARNKLPNVDFRYGDLTALPVADDSVDAVVCALALVHLEDLSSAMREFARVLRAGGRLVISDVHGALVLLGWQAQFRAADAQRGFVRLNQHLPSDYVKAAKE
jgi:ubiquinone/menaquinone biosynthesis C-methylase UbiE